MLQVKNIEKKYKGVKAVDSLSFEVKTGEIFALLGPNGAGKTSTVRMIMQIMHPDSGSIEFHHDMMHQGKVNRALLGYLPEERGLYQDVPLIKTLVYLATLRGSDPDTITKKAQYWLERLGLWDRRNEKISTLSKGNQQKIQFVASILHSPKFAILDEPFSGFDPINQELVSDLIKELRKDGMTVLLSAHQMQLVERLADRMLLINQGKAQLSGTMDEIRGIAGSNLKILVKYESSVPEDQFRSVHGINSVEVNDDGSVALFVQNNHDMNSLMLQLTKIGKLEKLHTETVGLHDIFIQSFSKKQ